MGIAAFIDRAGSAWDGLVCRARNRSRIVDRLWLAGARYDEVNGARLAAAIAYYGFFAALALGLLAVSILGYVLAGNHAAVAAVNHYLAQNLPFLKSSDITNARHTVAAVSTVSLVLAGIGWVDGMSSSQRAVWSVNERPGNTVIRRLVDLALLVGLGLLLALSLWVSGAIQGLARDLVGWDVFLSAIGQVLAFLVNLLVAGALLAAVPRLRMPVRRLLPSVLLVAVGVTLLSTVGRVLIGHTERNAAYQVAGWAVGLLVTLNLFSQLLLFGAALAATGGRGRVVDLAAGPGEDPDVGGTPDTPRGQPG